ncbi:hypothetical protein C0J52_00440 [Blattella germanica]|nr:hypothetical protein C0J52_00440 [Blattella germanica]
MDVIYSNINEKCGNELEACGAKLRNPRVIIYNVPDDIQIDNAKEAIIQQNLELKLEEAEILPKFIFKNKKQHNHLIIEVGPETR